MVRQYRRFNIDITREPILVYPTLHYQNGGIKIDTEGATGVPGLYAAGECSGGVHGRNRLIGNSTLELFVFGRRAGKAAALYAKEVKRGNPTLEHVRRWQKDIERAGLADKRPLSPKILPNYTRNREQSQMEI
jgi:succinate dehydrogenase / fumarate reductase flavoprotein subunit